MAKSMLHVCQYRLCYSLGAMSCLRGASVYIYHQCHLFLPSALTSHASEASLSLIHIESYPLDLRSSIGPSIAVAALSMGRLCSLELRLRPAGVDVGVPSLDSSRSRSKESMENSQQLTILYDGKICVCDATEIQARAILCLANSETEERLESPPPLPALSMKRSLQRFLQKRRSRLQAASPYKQ